MPITHPHGLIYDDTNPDMESRRIRQHRAWYAETAARRAEWVALEAERDDLQRAIDAEQDGLGWMVFLCFAWACLAGIIMGVVFWSFRL